MYHYLNITIARYFSLFSFRYLYIGLSIKGVQNFLPVFSPLPLPCPRVPAFCLRHSRCFLLTSLPLFFAYVTPVVFCLPHSRCFLLTSLPLLFAYVTPVAFCLRHSRCFLLTSLPLFFAYVTPVVFCLPHSRCFLLTSLSLFFAYLTPVVHVDSEMEEK